MGVGVGWEALLTNLKFGVVDRVSASIIPDAESWDRSVVEVVMQYCTAVPSDCWGIVAE